MSIQIRRGIHSIYHSIGRTSQSFQSMETIDKKFESKKRSKKLFPFFTPMTSKLLKNSLKAIPSDL